MIPTPKVAMHDHGDNWSQVLRSEEARHDDLGGLLNQYAQFRVAALAAFATLQDEEEAVAGEEVGPGGGVGLVWLWSVAAAGSDWKAELRC